jgi:predicted RecA/RadA family phage recombinase
MHGPIQKGEILSIAAPYAVASGGGALVGALFGVAVDGTKLCNIFSLYTIWRINEDCPNTR